MAPLVLGLDIGGANLKAATAGGRAVSVPFALWKQPDGLPAALAALVAQFPDATEFAVTMTGELCDCFETKRAGVHAILDAVESAAAGRPVRVWSTDGAFVSVDEARCDYLKVAAANWHALATFAGRYAPDEGGLLVDVGSTTTDIIPLLYGVPNTTGRTDPARLRNGELVYCGVRRTPVCAVVNEGVCAELFATTQDVYVVLGLIPEEASDRDTADGRPLTVEYSLARLARMLGGDSETLADHAVIDFATRVHGALLASVVAAARRVRLDMPTLRTVIVSGQGEFLGRRAVERLLGETRVDRIVSLHAELGPDVSACGPAYAVAVLAGEEPNPPRPLPWEGRGRQNRKASRPAAYHNTTHLFPTPETRRRS